MTERPAARTRRRTRCCCTRRSATTRSRTSTTEVEARTIGAALRTPALDPGRHRDVNPYYGIPPIGSYPYDGSALVVWDSGSPTPPTNNTPPRAGADPHSHPRNTAIARAQKSEFLKIDGKVVDTCGAGPCYANGYTGGHEARCAAAAVALATLVAAAALAAGALGVATSPAELVSTGPAGGNGPLTAAYAGSSDGRRAGVLRDPRAPGGSRHRQPHRRLRARERRHDHAGLDGPDRRERRAWTRSSTARRPTARACSSGRPSGSTAADTDSASDVYERAGGATTLVSTGSTGGNGPQGAFFDGVSADGARVFFHTAERLDRGRHGLAGGRLRALRRRDGAASRPGRREATAPSPRSSTAPPRTGRACSSTPTSASSAATRTPCRTSTSAPAATTALVSIGPDGGNGPFPAFFDAASEDGTRVILSTDEVLTEPDADAQFDVYQRDGGTMSVLSATDDAGNGGFDALYTGSSRDGLRVFFESAEQLARRRHGRPGGRLRAIGRRRSRRRSAGQRRIRRDVRRRRGGRLPRALRDRGEGAWRRTPTPTWTSTTARGRPRSCRRARPAATGPSTPSSRMSPTTARARSSPRRRAWSPTDSDSVTDVYERAGGTTSVVSHGSGGGNGAFNASVRGAHRQTARPRSSRRPSSSGAGDTDSVGGRVRRPGPERTTRGRRARARCGSRSSPPTSPARRRTAQHGPPLAFGSCAQPQQSSQDLTVGTPDANGQPAASVGLPAARHPAGNPATPARRGGRGGVVVDHGRARERGPRRLHR